MRHVEHAGEIDGDDVFPILEHGRILAEHAVAPRDTGIVDKYRDRPDLVSHLLRHRDAGVAVGDIERKALRLAAGIEDFLRRLTGCRLIDVERHHARALPGIAGGDGAADPGAGAGHDGDVVFK